MGIELWDPVPGNNDSAPPAGAPEGATLISDLNDISRQIMADVRVWYENPEYRDLGLTLVSSASTDSIVVEGDEQARFAVGQPVEFDDAGGTNNHGHISEITLVNTDTNLKITIGETTENTVTPDVTALRVGPKIQDYDTPAPVTYGVIAASIEISSTGIGTNVPDGMNVEYMATGRYRLNHNLGHKNYMVMVTPRSNTAAKMAGYINNLNNSVMTTLFNANGEPDDQHHSLLLVDYS